MDVESLDQLLERTVFNSAIKKFEMVDGCQLNAHFNDIKEEIENLQVKDSDVWICSYPKTGEF